MEISPNVTRVRGPLPSAEYTGRATHALVCLDFVFLNENFPNKPNVRDSTDFGHVHPRISMFFIFLNENPSKCTQSWPYFFCFCISIRKMNVKFQKYRKHKKHEIDNQNNIYFSKVTITNL